MKPWLIAALVALGAVVLWQRAEVRRAHDGRVAAEATANALGRIADSIARVERVRDVVRVERRTAWDTLRLTDTLDRVSRDTIVVRAEEAIAACESVLSACQHRAAALTEQRDSLVSALKLSKREARGCRVLGLIPCPEVVAGYGATLGTDGRVGLGPGVLVGVRLW